MRKKNRNIFGELIDGVEAMRKHREGKLTLKTHKVEPLHLPEVSPKLIREVRENLHVSQGVFASLLQVNPRTLANWEQGRSKPNDQAAALILLVQKFPDTLDRLKKLI
jgi:putative transcriptional regulator